jgi:hypothetical protein
MEQPVPSNFRTVIADFANDLSITFSDYSYLWSRFSEPDLTDLELKNLFDYCLKVYPERFFDILYQNDDMFKQESDTDTYFLPKVSFRFLFNCEGITENTKKTMWKYLQLVLFTIVGGVKDKATFGDTMDMFQGIDENELQNKLKDTMSGITDFFSNMEKNMNSESSENNEENSEEDSTKEKFRNMFENMSGSGLPNMENIHDHLRKLFDGKIGKLAQEMAEELTGEFTDLVGEDIKDARNTQDVIKKLMKNPKKIMDLVKKVGGKLDSKMKSGEISREELMKEAGDLYTGLECTSEFQ